MGKVAWDKASLTRRQVSAMVANGRGAGHTQQDHIGVLKIKQQSAIVNCKG